MHKDEWFARLRAQVIRDTSGSILCFCFRGVGYNSLSGMAGAICLTPENGWEFWRAE